MNRPDLLKKYTEETGNCLELLDKMLDFTKTNLEVLKYIEWLEGDKELEELTDYIQETANNLAI
jgi:aminopeptidase-like protein